MTERERERERESKKRAKTSGFSLLQEKIPIKGRKKFRSHIRNTFFAKKEENEIAPVQEKPGPAGNAVRSEKKYRQLSFAKGPALYYTARKEKIKRFFPFFPFFSVQQNFFSGTLSRKGKALRPAHGSRTGVGRLTAPAGISGPARIRSANPSRLNQPLAKMPPMPYTGSRHRGMWLSLARAQRSGR